MSRSPMALISGLISGLALAGCSVVGIRSGTEEPKYTTVAQVGAVEIRAYAPRIAAETVLDADEEAARSAGFRRIAAYIFGANAGSAKIAMTAPVAQQSADAGAQIAMTAPVAQSRDAAGRWVVRFFMPAEYTLASLPQPNDSQVRLVEVPAETMAVLRFSGIPGTSMVSTKRAALLAVLDGTAWVAQGQPVAWFYDPPWTLPPFRRNEVAVAVTSRP